jgi:hypothetical protein
MSLITGTSLPLIVVIVAEEAAQSSCDSMTDSSSCARSSPARPLLALLLRSFSIRRSAAATRHAEPHALGRVCGIFGFGGIRAATARLMHSIGMRLHARKSRASSSVTECALEVRRRAGSEKLLECDLGKASEFA